MHLQLRKDDSTKPHLIRSARTASRLSRKQLATRLGVAQSTISRWETGRSTPGPLARQELDRLFGPSVHAPSSPISADSARGCSPPGPTVLALFAGAGGLALGLKEAGYDVIAATDVDPFSRDTFQANWPGVPFILKDVRILTRNDILDATGGRSPDIIAGGPPCQGFSTLGDKLSADARNLLFDDFFRTVHDLRPKAVILENVRAVTTMYGGRYADYIVRKLTDAGYDVQQKTLDAADYGVPQHRLRAFFVALHRGSGNFTFPEPTCGPNRQPHATVGDAIMDLTSRGEEVPGHVALKHSDVVVRRYALIPEGGRLPPPEQLPTDIRRKNFGNTYKRLHRQMPSLTLVPGNNAFPVHPTLDRSLTPREAARLQSFSDEYVFVGDRRRQCILVGNAVPPELARVLGKALRRVLSTDRAGAPQPTISPSDDGHARDILDFASLERLPVDQGFVDLYCGAGGFTIGFAKAGLRPICCVDIDYHVNDMFTENFPSIPFIRGDASTTPVQDQVVEAVGGEPLLVIGGPPCQGFSVFGKRRFVNTKNHEPRLDPRNKLVFTFVDLVSRLRPRWVVMENVAGFLTLDNGSFLDRVTHDLQKLGYGTVEHRVLNTANYGVPQLRKRFVLIANRTGHIIPWPKRKYFENPREWQRPFRKIGEVLTDLADPVSHDKHSCHVAMNHKPRLVERYRFIPEGGRLKIDDLPPHLRSGYRTKTVKNYSHIFRRLHRDHPSIALVPGHNAFPIHPWLDRALTVREAARIQTFPDEAVFKGPRQEQCIQVGNAFPPMLAELIANNIVKAEKNDWFPGRVPKSATYALVELHDPR